MNEPFPKEPDDLEPLLSPKPSSAREQFRDHAFARSRAILRRRKWLRHGIKATGWLACFLTGLLTAKLLYSDQSPSITGTARVSPLSIPESLSTPQGNALALEWEALDNPKATEAAFQVAGDRYLESQSDYESALRCYRQALDRQEPDNPEPLNDPSWLYLALKHNRELEEK